MQLYTKLKFIFQLMNDLFNPLILLLYLSAPSFFAGLPKYNLGIFSRLLFLVNTMSYAAFNIFIWLDCAQLHYEVSSALLYCLSEPFETSLLHEIGFSDKVEVL